MCGFFITNSSKVTRKHEHIIENNLRFRGPDSSSGLQITGKWKSYHSRLSIIDLTDSANQPVFNDDSSQLVFNGEILNYKSLGYKYFGKEYYSDTILLNDLICNNKLKISELDGFFAFVFIGSDQKIKYACRDRFGVKPLFYLKKDNEVTFASEPNVLKELFNPKVSTKAVEEYHYFRAPIFQGSFFEEVSQVKPGSCYINGDYFSAEKELSNSSRLESADINYIEKSIEESLIKGINSRKISDAPIGLLLSKGIDSNLIRHYGEFDKFYSIGFDGDEDIKYLKEQKIENLTIMNVEAEDFRKAFEKLLALRKEPMSVPNEVLLYLISVQARNDGIKVLLSGEGADEFFGGYDRIFTWATSTKEFDLDKFLELYAYSPVSKESCSYERLTKIFDNCILTDCFDKVRWFFIRYHMPVLFRRLDFSLMAAGIEGREPIANSHLFDICKILSSDVLMVEGLGKEPLRRLLSKFMGKNFSYEPKVGFPVNVKNIFENPRNLSSYDLWFSKNMEILK